MNPTTGEFREFPDGHVPAGWVELGCPPKPDCPVCRGQGSKRHVKRGHVWHTPCPCTQPKASALVAREWSEFRQVCYGRGLLPPAQELQVRQAFYAGALAMLALTDKVAGELPEHAAVQVLELVRRELALFGSTGGRVADTRPEAAAEGAVDENVRERMRKIAAAVDEELPVGWGYVALTFPFDERPGRINYVSNGRREDVLVALRDFLRMVENNPQGGHV
ncbi:MAG: hypothetical protein AB1705_15430 [Verrucomicrobiota bacterium]